MENDFSWTVISDRIGRSNCFTLRWHVFGLAYRSGFVLALAILHVYCFCCRKSLEAFGIPVANSSHAVEALSILTVVAYESLTVTDICPVIVAYCCYTNYKVLHFAHCTLCIRLNVLVLASFTHAAIVHCVSKFLCFVSCSFKPYTRPGIPEIWSLPFNVLK